MKSDSPYSTPKERGAYPVLAELEKNKRLWRRMIWITAILSVTIPILTTALSILGMRQAFKAVGSSGIGNPEALAAHISELLIATAAGLFFAILPLILMIISLIKFTSYRKKLSQFSASSALLLKTEN